MRSKYQHVTCADKHVMCDNVFVIKSLIETDVLDFIFHILKDWNYVKKKEKKLSAGIEPAFLR